MQDVNATVIWGVVNTKGDTSYLFGVLHDLGDSYFDKYPIIRTELRKSNCIVLENNFFGNAATGDPSNQKWFNSLSIEDYNLIDNYLKEKAKNYSKHSHVDLKALERAGNSPIDVYATILQLSVCDECKIHLMPREQPIEQYLKDWCTYHNDKHHPIPLIGLENSGDVTVKIFGFNDSNILDSIKRVILQPQRDTSDCNLVAKYWDMKGYNYNFSVPSQAVDTNNLYMLDQRNNKWMPKLKELLNNDRTFIAVGLLHLSYKNGLINQLIAAGYNVFPIAMN